MGTVIYHEFKKKQTPLELYLTYLRDSGIEEEDIEDVAHAIDDPIFYQNCDEVVIGLVDNYFDLNGIR